MPLSKEVEKRVVKNGFALVRDLISIGEELVLEARGIKLEPDDSEPTSRNTESSNKPVTVPHNQGTETATPQAPPEFKVGRGKKSKV